MDCPECGHKLPAEKSRCIYCGAVAPGETGASGEYEKGEREPIGDQIPAEERNIAQGVLIGEGHAPEGSDETPDDKVEQDLWVPFTMNKSRRPKPMNRIMLIIIFFASAAFMGALVWLMG